MNRIWHLQQTLKKNLREAPAAEFVVVDYGSKEPIRPWILQEFSKEMNSGRLLFLETSQASYKPAHAMNLAQSWATGDIICVLNADGIIDRRFSKNLAELVKTPNAMSYGITLKSALRSVGGYNENLDYGYGWHIEDLIGRLAGICKRLSIPKMNGMNHGEDLRICNINFDKLRNLDEFLVCKVKEAMPSFDTSRLKTFPAHLISGLVHKAISDYDIAKTNLIANKDKPWAEAMVTVNAQESVNSWMYRSEFFKL